MKAITIHQPYAHLIAIGDKRIENRTWPTKYRGPIVIHAGKSRQWLSLDDGKTIDEEYNLPLSDMAFGAIVATAELANCIHINDIAKNHGQAQLYPWLKWHDHTHGPWCWVLTGVVRLESPISYKGAQGLFNVPDDVLRVAA